MSIGIFTGAGASAPLDLPVMEDMLDAEFRRDTLEKGLEQHIYDLAANWAAAESEDDTVDFELLYTAVDRFTNLNISDLEALPFSPHRGGSGLYFVKEKGGKTTLFLPELTRKSKDLRVKLQARVHDLIGEVDAERAAEIYLSLFEAVYAAIPAGTAGEANTGTVFVFTTNYDRAVEVPFWEGLTESFSPSLHLIDGMAQQTAGPRAFDNHEYDRKPGPGEVLLKLFKLHESLHWRREGDRVLESAGDEYVGRNALIYPIRESKDELPHPFPALFRRFQSALTDRIDTLLVIGSSFRDKHIRDIVVKALRGSAALERLILLDPRAGQIASSLVEHGIPEGDIQALPKRFGEKESLEAVKAAL